LQLTEKLSRKVVPGILMKVRGWTGRENAKEYLRNNPEFMQKLDRQLKEMEKARLLGTNNLEES